MDRSSNIRNFWQVYTPRNILEEVKSRLSKLKDGAGTNKPLVPSRVEYDGAHANAVGQFYDVHHDKFLSTYGEVIQAFRTKDVSDLLNYQLRSIGFQPGQRLLDAGCGIGAPAIHFATNAGVQIDAITISNVQFEAARDRIAEAGLSARVRVMKGDYHELESFFARESFDVVYFLESFGHSRDKKRAIDSCWAVLKPGGTLYIKDLFRRIPLRAEHAQRIEREIRKIDETYRYEVGDLNAVLDCIRGRGFIVDTLKSIDLDLNQFEDLAISNEFQELTGLARIDNWSEYVFPVDFFELKCIKPEFDLEERLDRHFLQNRYHGQLDKP